MRILCVRVIHLLFYYIKRLSCCSFNRPSLMRQRRRRDQKYKVKCGISPLLYIFFFLICTLYFFFQLFVVMAVSSHLMLCGSSDCCRPYWITSSLHNVFRLGLKSKTYMASGVLSPPNRMILPPCNRTSLMLGTALCLLAQPSPSNRSLNLISTDHCRIQSYSPRKCTALHCR